MPEEPIILIAVPDQDVAEELRQMLRREGRKVLTTPHGMRLLSYAESHPPALIILASQLSDMSGFEVCRRLRQLQQTRGIPLLFVTGEPGEQTDGLKLGASDIITIPLQQEVVAARVKTHLELAALRPSRIADQSTPSLQYQVGSGDGWISLAMRAGRMFAFEWDPQTDHVYRTHTSGAILGNGAEAMKDTGTNFFGTMVHPDDRDRLRRVVGILSPVFDMYDTQYRLRRPDGLCLNVRESGRALFDSGGRMSRVVGIVADITQPEAAQGDHEREWADVLRCIERIPVAAALANDHGDVEYINQQFTKHFGYHLDDIAEIGDWWKCANISEEDGQLLHLSSGFISGQNTASKEYQITAKNGVEHLVRVCGARLGRRKLVFFDDTSVGKDAEPAQAESAALFRLVADTAPIMLWASGVDKLCTFFNKGWLSFTGRSMEQELGNGWAEGVHPEDLAQCLETYSSAFHAREEFQMQYRLRRADGEFRWILDHGAPRFARDGTFEGYIGSATDVTELRRTEEEMLTAQKLESLGVLAGGVVHDFSNYLGCILADADVTLAELDSDSPARHGVERIEAMAIQASRIVRQILSYSRHESQEMEAVDIAQIIRGMLQLLRACTTKNTTFHIDLPQSLPIPRGNATQLQQVLMNLVLNAGEAMGEEGGIITITGKFAPTYDRRWSALEPLPSSKYVSLEISDNGAGMTEEVRKRIFEPFFSTKLPGRGLGLAAVQRIIRGHGGSIAVSSAAGEGTTFEVLLPCDAPACRPRVAELPYDEATSGRGAVLLVEDEETLRASVAMMLRKRGVPVLEASDGDLAIELIRDRGDEIAVVLLDLTLPGKSSEEVFEELKRNRTGVKVFLTSAYGRESVVGALKTVERENFIRKPYRLSEVLSVVCQARRRNARRMTATPKERNTRVARTRSAPSGGPYL